MVSIKRLRLLLHLAENQMHHRKRQTAVHQREILIQIMAAQIMVQTVTAVRTAGMEVHSLTKRKKYIYKHMIIC